MGSDDAETITSLRRGTRTKRPTTRFEPESEPSASVKRARDDAGASRAKRQRSASRDADVVDDAGEASGSDDADGAEEEDDGVYCTCRGRNDGSPMICCGRCSEWFHFRCVGLSKRAAERLKVYNCESCKEKSEKASLAESAAEAETDADAEAQAAKDADRAEARAAKDDGEFEAVDGDDDEAEDDGEDITEEVDEPPKSVSRSTRSSRSSRPARTTIRASRPTNSTTDPVRTHVLTTFTSLFEPLFEAEQAGEDAANQYATELENELHRSLGDSPGLRSYKERFRTLLFNLKDKRNTSLRSRITSGALPAANLAHLSNEELANDQIREATEKAKRDALQQAVLREKSDGPARKITHKGEVDIERDAADTDAPRLQDPDASRNDLGETPSEAAPAHEHMIASPKFTPAADKRSVSPMPQPISFSDVWATGEATAPAMSDHHVAEASFDVDDAPEDTELGPEADGEADTFIDSFLGDEQPKEDALASHTPEGSPAPDAFVVRAAAAKTHHNASLNAQPVVWDGVITMPEYTSAYVHARQVTSSYPTEAPLWRDFFPATERTIEGRLPSHVAIDYLQQVRLSPRNSIVVLLLDAGGEHPAAERHAADSSLHSSPALDKLVHYFADKQRFGVLAPAPGAQGTLVKDFYLAPLLSHEPVPAWFKDIHAPGLGAEWDAERPANVLLVVLVLFKAGLEGRTESAPPTAKSPAPTEPPAPISLDALLNVKPDAIQNLLSTLGEGPSSGGSLMGAPGSSSAPGSSAQLPPGGTAPGFPMLPAPPSGLSPPPRPPPGMAIGPGLPPPPIARPMRAWGGAPPMPPSRPPPGVAPPFGAPEPHTPWNVKPGGWYGGNPERTVERQRRRGGRRAGAGRR